MRYVERPLYDKESVLIPRKGTLNNVMYVNQPFWSVDTMFYTEMRMPNVAKFVYHFVKPKHLASMNAARCSEHDNGHPKCNGSCHSFLHLFLKNLNYWFAPMYKAMQENDAQSKILADLRDTLLPKLMSGELMSLASISKLLNYRLPPYSLSSVARATSKELPLFIVLLNTKENDDERTTYPRDTA